MMMSFAGLRQGGEAFRLGGDEFAVLLPRQDERQATGVARSIVERVASLQIDGVGVGGQILKIHHATRNDRITCPTAPLRRSSTASGTSGRMWQASSSSFAWARRACDFMASPRRSRSPKTRFSNSNLPASILEKSRMSLMMPSSDSADTRTMVR